MYTLDSSMQPVKTVEDATALLKDIKKIIATNKIWFNNRSAKNTQSLANLGITVAMQIEIIKDLAPTDYYCGPEPDEKYPDRAVAVFGYDFRGTELYIKFSIGLDGTAVVCLSFHESEYPMQYPFN
ncbi:type II toxin-antitoxin system MqsR family toxin [Chitinophaga filiformis]|uniref:Motility quorum-sensing regulator, toxin of MqsA n=1 Tax=Chitinophaga filiformis TaxID=104663 RepID=A0A1G7GKW4_CHIFI|nr:type II toxin-antitoxin system MqsR family toxin [Chitinophaga filiformis]SDE88766.1 Motility quorum-sensing regulator, toxin of MqsA [Chitinophaga filiformis]